MNKKLVSAAHLSAHPAATLTTVSAWQGLIATSASLTNVFNLQPKPTNAIENLCGKKVEGIPNRPPIAQGKYIRRNMSRSYTDSIVNSMFISPTLSLLLARLQPGQPSERQAFVKSEAPRTSAMQVSKSSQPTIRLPSFDSTLFFRY